MKTLDEAVKVLFESRTRITEREAALSAEELRQKYPFIDDINDNPWLLEHIISVADRTLIDVLVCGPDKLVQALGTVFYMGVMTGMEMEKSEMEKSDG